MKIKYIRSWYAIFLCCNVSIIGSEQKANTIVKGSLFYQVIQYNEAMTPSQSNSKQRANEVQSAIAMTSSESKSVESKKRSIDEVNSSYSLRPNRNYAVDEISESDDYDKKPKKKPSSKKGLNQSSQSRLTLVGLSKLFERQNNRIDRLIVENKALQARVTELEYQAGLGHRN